VTTAHPIRVGVLGAARITPLAILEPSSARDDVVITAVAARDPARARAYARQHRIAAVEPDYAALVARDDLDLIYVALPPAGHAEWTIRALEAGKSVLCEKPFARDAEEGREMVRTAAQRGLHLLEAFHYRFHTVVRQAEAILADGVLGRLTHAEAHLDFPIPRRPGELRWSAAQGGGALMDLGCYPLHLLRTLLNQEPEVTAAAAIWTEGVDKQMDATLRFPEGVMGRIGASMTVEIPNAKAVVVGERGRLMISNYISPQNGCRFVLQVEGHDRVLSVEGPSTYEAQLDHVIQVLRGTAKPLTGGQDAIGNMVAIDAVAAMARRPG
jgi:predicted dehydrogenase